jgi:hypothetical protein
MLDSPENLYVMEWNLIIKPAIPRWKEEVQGEG